VTALFCNLEKVSWNFEIFLKIEALIGGSAFSLEAAYKDFCVTLMLANPKTSLN